MKKFISIITLSLASFMSSAASVSFPEAIDVLAVNGLNNVDGRYLELNQGHNLIEVRYSDLFEASAEDSNWVRSEPLYLYLDFDVASHYQALIPNIKTEEDAYLFIENPMLQLRDAKGDEKQLSLMTHSQLMAKLLLPQQ